MTQNHKGQLPFDLGIAAPPYTPKYEITESIRRSLDDIDRGRWAFERLLIDPKYESWLRRRAFIRSGHHSLHIEGNRLSEDRVASILEDLDIGEMPGQEYL